MTWSIDVNWPSGGVHFDFFVVGFVFFVMEKCFKLNAANNFFDILSGSEFVAFLGYGNEVKAFAKNRFFSA